MYKLTERRLEAARDILEKYREQLHRSGSISAMSLEKELRDCWGGMGYQTLKGIIIDMLNNERYRLVAAYYMQHQNAPGPVSEFKPHLARLYGTPTYDPFDKQGTRKAFWEAALGKNDDE
ncbi:MAG TPA: hypothetical protein VMP01_03060 [Pirellulaceae bacterium]|nr:hypothetical protein [Pirellulaceae bacterium]